MRNSWRINNVNNRVYLTGIIDTGGPGSYARAGYILLTTIDRIRCKRANNGYLVLIMAIMANNARSGRRLLSLIY